MLSTREVIVLGSTGSIGVQALDVMSARPERFRVAGLAAGGTQLELLADQVAATRAPTVAVPTATAAAALACLLRDRGVVGSEILSGDEAASELAGRPCDVVLNGITGYAGLLPTLSTLQAGTRLALANKESLVCGGVLVTRAAAVDQIVPVDSEHSALAQARRGGRVAEVRRLILTASGGPFRGRTRAQLARVTVADALAHPTWQMGRVVTINSASLVNKGLELIEAALLFKVPYDDITVVVHPQSIVHSMVEFVDGSTLAQASPPDMRLPIALGLGWPDRVPLAATPCRWTESTAWTFEPLDDTVFPAVDLARRVGRAAGTAPAVFNAANEICVDAFCAGQIGFLDSVDTVAAVVTRHLASADPSPAPPTDCSQAGTLESHPQAAGSVPLAVDPSAAAAGSPGAYVPDRDLTLAAVRAADAWARVSARALVAQKGD
jgi:1-deoxy-D-xylulose-5-phosphate reductoisomerase